MKTDLKNIPNDEPIEQYSQRIISGIPLLINMEVNFEEPTAGEILAKAPLAPNINHKGIGFGGSLAALGAITGWSAITRTLQKAGIDANTIIAHEEMSYKAPINSDFTARAVISKGLATELLQQLREGKKHKLKIPVTIEDNTGIGCEFIGTYVSIPAK